MTMKHEGHKIRREEGKKPRTSGLLIFSCSYLLFFVLCFFYFWLVIEPHLIYYGFGTLLPDAPSFATGWSFLKDSLNAPGGPVLYASAFLSQGFCHAWLGALIIVLAGFCLAELARGHFVTAGWAHASLLAPLPAIMLFLLYSHYHHPLSVGLAVSLGLLLSLIFEWLPWRQPPVHIAICCLLASAGLWLGGAGTLLVFALMTLVHEVIAHRRWTTVTVALPVSVAITWALAYYVFLIPAREAFLVLTPFAPSATASMGTFLQVQVLLLYLFVPLVVSLVSAGKSILGRRASQPARPSQRATKKERRAPTGQARPWLAILAKSALSALPLGLLALGLYVSHEGLRKPFVLSNYYSRQRQWDKILELARHLPKGKSNAFVNHDILRALYHTGRLPYDMFCYPLIPESILLTHEKGQSDLTEWKLSDIFLELGHVNMAQKLASELLATKGRLGLALEELGWISIIKRDPDAARVYLNALSRDLVYHTRAQSLLRGLDNAFTPEQAANIDGIRSCMHDETAGVTGTESVDETLDALVKHHPRNRMAFEYLMACYLVTGQVDKVTASMGRLRDLGYPRIPTLYEEAILIYYGTKEREVDLTKFNISPETLRRYEAFVQTANAMQPQNKQDVLNRLVRDFGTSYFFFYTFGKVGLM